MVECFAHIIARPLHLPHLRNVNVLRRSRGASAHFGDGAGDRLCLRCVRLRDVRVVRASDAGRWGWRWRSGRLLNGGSLAAAYSVARDDRYTWRGWRADTAAGLQRCGQRYWATSKTSIWRRFVHRPCCGLCTCVDRSDLVKLRAILTLLYYPYIWIVSLFGNEKQIRSLLINHENYSIYDWLIKIRFNVNINK